jgi:murein DD-endopeptidase MepM/ murein hydrolase activator NlpD
MHPIPRWPVAVVVGLTMLVTTTIHSSAAAEDPDWNSSNNGNAESFGTLGQENQTDYPITFPLAAVADGFVSGTPTVDASDGFCYNLQPRGYSTLHCVAEGDAHRGQDFAPLIPGSLIGAAAYAAMGVAPVLAPVGGLVERSGCMNGNGNTMMIAGGFGFRFQLQHLAPGLTYALGATAVEGRRIGYAAATTTSASSCTNTAYGAPHLHFEMKLAPGTDSYANPVDPWTTLRTAYARPGLFADGTVDTSMRDVWVFVANAYGIGSVGYPAIRDSIGSNARLAVPSNNLNNLATVQFLANGTNTFDTATWRTGALVRRNGVASANWIRNAWFGRWLALGMQNSYLGWPIGNDDGVRQNFQGGCIRIINGTATAGTYGSATCP